MASLSFNSGAERFSPAAIFSKENSLEEIKRHEMHTEHKKEILRTREVSRQKKLLMLHASMDLVREWTLETQASTYFCVRKWGFGTIGHRARSL